jgi:hypothetical protein
VPCLGEELVAADSGKAQVACEQGSAQHLLAEAGPELLWNGDLRGVCPVLEHQAMIESLHFLFPEATAEGEVLLGF